MITEIEKNKLREETYNSHIVSKKLVHENLAIIVIKINEELNDFEPGQYLSIGSYDFDIPPHEKVDVKGKLIRRAYSVSSSLINESGNLSQNVWENTLELFVAKVEDGIFSPNLFSLNENDMLYTSPKFIGHYNLPEELSGETIVFISTGTGLAPHLTMLNHLLRDNYKGQLLIIECVRFIKDLAYFKKLSDLASKYDNVHYKALTTRDSNAKLYIQDYFKPETLKEEFNIEIDSSKSHVFLCGNPNMIGIPKRNRVSNEYEFPIKGAMCEILMKNFNMTPFRPKLGGNIHYEKYW
jgi:ferredoxin/flavodoxin---NADP+ reductase